MERAHGVIDEIEAAIEVVNPTFRGLGFALLEEVYHWMGDEARALALSDTVTSETDAQEVLEVMLWTDWDRAVMLGAVGRFEESLRAFEAHAELCRRIQDAGFWTARSLNSRGWVCMQLGDFEAGERWNRESLEAAGGLGDPEIVRNAQLNLADCALARGEVAEALAILDDVETACAADSTRGAEWMKWRYIQHLYASASDARLAAGDAAAALEYSDRCLEQALATNSRRYIARGNETRARALLALDRTDEAVAAVHQAMSAADEVGAPTLRWRTALAQGDVLAAAGRADAVEAYRAGLTIAEDAAAGFEDRSIAERLLSSAEVGRLRAGAAGA